MRIKRQDDIYASFHIFEDSDAHTIVFAQNMKDGINPPHTIKKLPL